MATALSPKINILEDCIQSIKADVSEHDKWINGNGKEGAKVVLARMDERMKVMDEKLDTLFGWIKGIAIAIVTSGTVYLLFNLVPILFEHLGS